MMLCYKVWIESRLRFLVAAAALALYCLIVMGRARTDFPVPDLPTIPYSGFVWSNLYGNAVPAIFSIVALLLGLGGLQRERSYGTAPFTLALPVSRLQIVASRALVGLVEMAGLTLIPVVMLPTLSPWIAHQSYSASAPFDFALLFMSWGAVWFAVGLLWSSVLFGEYVTPLAGLLSPFIYMIVYARVSEGGRRFLAANPFSFMSGIAQLQPNTGTFIEPLPWIVMGVLAAISVGLMALAVSATDRQSF